MPLNKALNGAAFLAFDEKRDWLVDELCTCFGAQKDSLVFYGDLVYWQDAPAEKIKPFWCSTVYFEPFTVEFQSVSEAANALKQIQRNWAPYQFTLFRRASLIQEKLPYINLKPRNFPYSVPQTEIGAWTLIDEHTMIASAKTSSFLPCGKIQFNEDHENPPSRAYLKIQEALVHFQSFFGDFPQKGQHCFEAGACPGGWTYVLVQLGCLVFAVDRSELAENLMKNPSVKFLAHDAFTLKCEDIEPVDWVFSDVICYPERLLEWVKLWLARPRVPNMICTIKMQGETNWETIKAFDALPDSKVIHLNYNKHELTWLHKGSR